MSDNNNSSKPWQPSKGWLQDKKIPLDKDGDPDFHLLDYTQRKQYGDDPLPCVLDVFTPEQVVYLVNKQLYGLLYQKDHHRKRAAAEREALAPVKLKLKQMFGVAWIKATPQQMTAAIDAVKEDNNRET